MKFDFDPAKSAANKATHGIDFVEAQALWADPDYIERPAQPATEPRVQIIGRIAQTTWSAFVTHTAMKKQSASSRSGGRAQTKKGSTVARKTAAALDALHDSGVEMSAHMDNAKMRRPHREIQRVNVDFPRPMLDEIDRAAGRLGVNRQAFIKMAAEMQAWGPCGPIAPAKLRQCW